jgi:hypothetical protein
MKKISKTGSQEHCVRVFREQDMLHCEVERSDQVLINLVECDVRIRRRPFQWEGHRRFERRIVFLSRAGIKAPILKGLVGCFSGDTT